MKKFRSSQASISINSCTELSKTQFSPVRVVKDTMKTFYDFKNKQLGVWSNAFSYIRLCIFWKCIQHTIHWNKTQMLTKGSFWQNIRHKNALFFLSRAPTHHKFSFNLWFLYELKHKLCLFKTVCGIFHFRFVDSILSFLKFTFLFNKTS